MIYLQNVYVDLHDSVSDIKDKVRRYATHKGLRIMGTYIISNKYSEDVTGCKLLVPSSQVQLALSANFWPEEIICREWVERRNTQRSNTQRSNSHARRGDEYTNRRS